MTKQELADFIEREIQTKINNLQGELLSLSEANKNDSKSTAGDKHETGRAMVQLEQEKLGKQLLDLQKTHHLLKSIDFSIRKDSVQAGSLITTNKGLFLLGIPFGQITVNRINIFCLSPSSPLGQLLLSKKEGDKIELNGNVFEITSLQ